MPLQTALAATLLAATIVLIASAAGLAVLRLLRNRIGTAAPPASADTVTPAETPPADDRGYRSWTRQRRRAFLSARVRRDLCDAVETGAEAPDAAAVAIDAQSNAHVSTVVADELVGRGERLQSGLDLGPTVDPEAAPIHAGAAAERRAKSGRSALLPRDGSRLATGGYRTALPGARIPTTTNTSPARPLQPVADLTVPAPSVGPRHAPVRRLTVRHSEG